MSVLTKKQRDIYEYIRQYILSEGIPPTYAMIAQFFGYSSKSTVAAHINRLCDKGYLTNDGGLRLTRVRPGPSNMGSQTMEAQVV